MGYIGVISHLLTIDPNFLGHPSGSCWKLGAFLEVFLKWWDETPTNPWGKLLPKNDQHLGWRLGGNPPFKESPLWSRSALKVMFWDDLMI